MEENQRPEYGQHYREIARGLPEPSKPARITARFQPPARGRQEVLILGSAGQRVVTAGEIFCLAGMTAGWYATQKNDYPITVLRGHSVSEMVLSPDPVDYTGIETPAVVVALADEGVGRRKKLLAGLGPQTLIIKAAGVDLPETGATVTEMDFKAHKIKAQDWALASLALMTKNNGLISIEMLTAAVSMRFNGDIADTAIKLVEQVAHA